MVEMTQTGSERGRTVPLSDSAGIKSNVAGNLAVVRSMPESLAAEAAVLGSMIIDWKCIADVIEIIGRDGFYRIEHQHIFDALIGLYQKVEGEAIDAVLLRDELEKRKLLTEVGVHRSDTRLGALLCECAPLRRDSKG